MLFNQRVKQYCYKNKNEIRWFLSCFWSLMLLTWLHPTVFCFLFFFIVFWITKCFYRCLLQFCLTFDCCKYCCIVFIPNVLVLLVFFCFVFCFIFSLFVYDRCHMQCCFLFTFSFWQRVNVKLSDSWFLGFLSHWVVIIDKWNFFFVLFFCFNGFYFCLCS